jgi:3-oxoacyl-[acyl-carrier protein] reductase
MSISLKNRVALVTGGSRGIGRAIAEALGGAGAAVAVNYRERADEAAAVVKFIESGGGRALAVRADVACAEAVDTMMREVRQALGPIDILVNNAGVAPRRELEETDEKDFDETVAINLKSAFLCTQAVLPHMRAQRWGRVINLSSIAGRTAMAGSGISIMYNVTKAGLEGLTRGHAARVAADGVTVNAIAPGLIDTDMGGPLVEAGAADAIPVGRSGTGDEIAGTAMMLVHNGFITGQTIAVNGGRLFV